MRNTEKLLQAFEASVERYVSELEKLDMEQLIAAPNEEEWSIGQMMMHLIQTTQYMHLRNIEQCMAGSDGVLREEAETTEAARAVFELGSFPDIRIRVPASPQYTPQQPESKEQLIEGFRAVGERMRRTEPALSQAPAGNKVLHPRFGPLNAVEWFLIIDMHYRHHFLQLERLKKELERLER